MKKLINLSIKVITQVLLIVSISSNSTIAQSVSSSLFTVGDAKTANDKEAVVQMLIDSLAHKLNLNLKSEPDTATKDNTQNNFIEFTLFGEGGLRNNLLKNADNRKAANGAISAGFKKGYNDVNVSFTISELTTKEVNNDNFLGASLLAPGIENNSISIRYNRFRDIKESKKRISFNGYILATSNKWSIDSTSYNANIFAANIGASWYPFELTLDDNDNQVKLWFDLGLNYRELFGEIIEAENEQLRIENFSTKDTRYLGFEPAVNLMVGKTILFAKAPCYFKNNQKSLKGLSGFQLQIGANVHANVLAFKKRDSRDKKTKTKKEKVKS